MFKQYLSNRNNIIVCLLLCIITILFFRNGIYNVLTWDTMGYNSYLPLIFENHSFHVNLEYFKRLSETYEITGTLYQYVDLENGNVFIKYPIGWAILMFPFYSIAEIWTYLSETYPNDGFSYPYQVCIFLGCYFYTILGVLLTYKMLKTFVNEKYAIITLITLYMGTNLLQMNISSIGSNHNLVFVIIPAFIITTKKFHESPNWKNAVLLGIFIGLAALIRPPSILIGFFVIFYQYQNFDNSLYNKIQYLFKNHFKLIIIALTTILLVYSPQMIYWKITAGKWLMNSYANNVGEGFDWTNPHTLKFLFSFKKGWFLYTPLMALSIIGFWQWLKKDKGSALGSLFILIIFIYVVSSWTTWWYAGSFSQRTMIDLYALLAIPLAFLIQDSWSKIYFKIIIVLIICLNLFQTYQVENRIIHLYAMTKKAYFKNFLKISPLSESERKWFDVIDTEEELRGVDLKRFKLIKNHKVNSQYIPLNDSNIYFPAQDFVINKISTDDHIWIESKWNYKGNFEDLKGKIFNSNYYYKDQIYHWRGSEINDSIHIDIDTTKQEIIYKILSLPRRSKNDIYRISIWKQSGAPIEFKLNEINFYEYKFK